MAIELVSARSVPEGGGERVFRVAILGRILATVILVAIALCLIAAACGVSFGIDEPLKGAIAGWCGAVLGLFSLLLCNDLRKALRSDAWLAVVAPQRLYVKWRSYQNVAQDPDERVVAALPYADIASARVAVREWITPGARGGTHKTKRRFVELTLKDVDTAELVQQLAFDRAGRSPDGGKKSTHWHHHPVSIEPGNVVRIDWDARESSAELIDELRRNGVQIGDDVASTADLVDQASDAEVGELARRGDVMGLTKILRVTQGLDLTTAHRKARDLVASERVE